MSLLHEQHRSLLYTRALLLDLLSVETRPKKVTELKGRVWRCLKHFPALDRDGRPIWSRG
jgi:hypothetical protein